MIDPEVMGLMEDEDEYTLGPCGCVDYHVADCSLVTGYSDDPPDPYEDEDWTSEIFGA